jgi:hypothetical protein
VSALVRKEVPFELAPGDHLPKTYQFEGTEGEICWVLVAAPIEGFGGRQLVPLLAGNLAASTGRTPGCVYEKRFNSHTGLTSF